MTAPSKQPYLFLVTRASVEARKELARRLRAIGATVVAEYGEVAVEALIAQAQLDGVRGPRDRRRGPEGSDGARAHGAPHPRGASRRGPVERADSARGSAGSRAT